MRYHLDSMLPMRAFSPRSGRARGFSVGGMTLEGSYNEPNYEMTGGGPEPESSVTVEAAPPDAGPAQSGGGGGGGGGVDQATLNQLYETYLGRAPDASGSQTWAGQDLNSVIAGITGSQEYANRGGGGGGDQGGGGGGGADLTALYQQFLGRAPDQSGAQTYAGWSTQDVTNAILGSQEYANRGSSTPGAQGSSDVNSLYQKYLGRDADPTGMQTWAGQSPEAIIAGITGSQEYQTRNPGAEPIVNTGPVGDPSTWTPQFVGRESGEDGKDIYRYIDPVTGNVYDSQSAEAKLLLSGAASRDKYLAPLDNLSPEDKQALYDLKTTDSKKYYSTVATELEKQLYEQYRTNSNYDNTYNQLQQLKTVAPEDYYKAQLSFLGQQIGWQIGQNTGDKAEPVKEELKKIGMEAQYAGVKYEDVKSIVNNSINTANIQNQQRIAEEAATGGSGFNFGKDVMPGVTMIAMAAATAASAGAAAPLGAAMLGSTAAAAVGATATAALGGLVIGAGMGALTAAVYNGNIEQGAIKGAISGTIGGAASGYAQQLNTAAELAKTTGTASGLIGSSTIQAIASASGLSALEVSKIVVNTASTAIAAAATGQVNRSNFAQTVATALASSAIAQYAQIAANKIDPTMSAAAINAVTNVARIATTATLNGGSVQRAIITNIPAIINGAVSAEIDETNRQNASQPTTPFGTENIGFTSGGIDRTLQQGLVDPYINAANDPIQAYAAQRNLTGSPLDNIRYSTNVMLQQEMPRQDVISNLAAVYNVDEKTAENYYQNTLANNTFERLAAKAEDPIALLNAAKMLTGDKQANLKFVADEMKNQGLSKSQIATNLEDLYQIPKDKAEAYANQLLSAQAQKKVAVQETPAKTTAPKTVSTWDDNTTKIPAFPTGPKSTWDDNTTKIPAFPTGPISPTWEDKSPVPRFDISTTWDDDTKLKPAGEYTWDEAGKIPAFPDANFQSRLSAYVSDQVPTLKEIEQKLPAFEDVQKSFMEFVDKQMAPGQPTVLNAVNKLVTDIANTIDSAPNTALATAQFAQMAVFRGVGGVIENFSNVFLSPFGRENSMYLAGKALSNFGWENTPLELQNTIKDHLKSADDMIKNAEPGMKELAAFKAYLKYPMAFAYRTAPEVVEEGMFLGTSALIGIGSKIMLALDPTKIAVAANVALNGLDFFFSGMGRTYDQLIANKVSHSDAMTPSILSGSAQMVVGMASTGYIDAAMMRRLSGEIAEFTVKGIAGLAAGSYSGAWIYSFFNNVIDQKAVNPDKPIDWNKANIEAATTAPTNAGATIAIASMSNFATTKAEVTVTDNNNVPLLKAPSNESESSWQAPKLLEGPQAAPKLLPASDQIAAVRDAQTSIVDTLTKMGISEDQANTMATKTIGDELVSQINENFTDSKNKLDSNKVLGTDSSGKQITVGDVVAALVTDEPILQGNETLAKEVKIKFQGMLGGIKLDENALVAQTQRAPEQKTTEGLPFKEKPDISKLFGSMDLTSPQTDAEAKTRGEMIYGNQLNTITLPSTSTVTANGTQTALQTGTQPQTQTQTQLQQLNPVAIDIALLDAILPKPVTQTKTVMEPVNPRPIPHDIAVLDPTKPMTTVTPPYELTPPKVNPPVVVNPPDVTTTPVALTPTTPATPKAPSSKTPAVPVATSTKKKKLINPPDLLADFAKGRKIALPLAQLMKLINTQPSNVIPMQNYQNPNPIPFNLEDELKAAKAGGLMRLATGGGSGGSNAGATPGSNISVGPGDASYSPIANFIKGSETKSYLPEKYDLQMFTYAPTPYNSEAALKAILAAAEGGIVHMAEGGDLNPAFDPGSTEVKMKGKKFAYHQPFVGLNMMSNAPRFNDGGEVGGHNPQFFSEGGLNAMENRYVTGEGDGTSDSIPAMLANGEFVIPADVVSSLGNGSNDSGASILDQFLKTVRDHKTQTGKKGLPPDSKGALGYLLEAKRKVRA